MSLINILLKFHIFFFFSATPNPIPLAQISIKLNFSDFVKVKKFGSYPSEVTISPEEDHFNGKIEKDLVNAIFKTAEQTEAFCGRAFLIIFS